MAMPRCGQRRQRVGRTRRVRRRRAGERLVIVSLVIVVVVFLLPIVNLVKWQCLDQGKEDWGSGVPGRYEEEGEESV